MSNHRLWLENYADLLGCDVRPEAVAVAIQDLQAERDRAVKSIPNHRKAAQESLLRSMQHKKLTESDSMNSCRDHQAHIEIIEVQVPEGMRISEVQQYTPKSVALTFEPDPDAQRLGWRIPTKADLLNVDSLPCRVWDRARGDWHFVELIAVSSLLDGRASYFTNHGSWPYAEIEVPINESKKPVRPHLTAKLRWEGEKSVNGILPKVD